MKILVAHHVEETWADTYRKHVGKDFDNYCEQLSEHILKKEYDRVYVTVFESSRHPENLISFYLQPLVNKIYEYAYGWDKDCVENSPKQTWTKGGNHSQYVLIEDWMFELKKHDVYICGGFDGECLEDLEIALEFVGINFTRVSEFIY